MYRNFHGSGEVDAEFDDICEGAKSDQYRITVNSDNKSSPNLKVHSTAGDLLKYGAIELNRVQ